MYDYAQTFYVDAAVSSNTAQVGITKLNLFFRAVPKITGNKSGIYAPGVEIFIAPTVNGIPVVDRFGLLSRQPPVISRKEYVTIRTSADASVPTTFLFPTPFQVKTGFEYAVVVKFDGNEDFVLWSSTQGDNLLGTTTPSPGPSGQYIGKLFSYISPVNNSTNPSAPAAVSNAASATIANYSTQNPLSVLVPDATYLLQSWKPLNATDLKFQVWCARYSHAGTPVYSNTAITDDPTIDIHLESNTFITQVSNNILRLTAPSYPMEYITFERKLSSNLDSVIYGDKVYQPQPYYPGGAPNSATISVTSANGFALGNASYLLANGSAFSFSHIFDIGTTPEYIVVVSEDHYGAGLDAVNVRQVKGLFGANGILCSEAFTFTNAIAKFYKTPVGKIYSKSRDYLFGTKQDILILVDSNANGTLRFVNNQINSISISGNGSGYANSDYIEITGFEDVDYEVKGGYKATANIRVNGSGALTAVYLSNAGAGFVNTSTLAYTIYNANAVSSAGTNGNLTFTVETTLQSDLANSTYKGCKIVNLDAVSMTPDVEVQNPAGTVYTIKNRTSYYSQLSSNTYSGKAYWLYNDSSITDVEVKDDVRQNFNTEAAPVLPSRSNQFAIRFANGAVANTGVVGTYLSNSSVYMIDISSNNDFASVQFDPQFLHSHYAKYSINNDYTNEHTNYGNALAKGISTKVSLTANLFAEDLLVYVTAFKPANTDIQVYARIHNSYDSEAFDDKDWTRLDLVDGVGVYSSRTNQQDLKEYTYNFSAAPNTTALAGVVTTVSANVTVTGSNTLWDSTLAANDLVKISQILFPENYIVDVVNSVVSNTSLTLKNPVTFSGVVGTGLKIERITYPLQGFNNITNDNVVRYYTTSRGVFDTFNTFQLKVIMLSDNDYIVPKIDDIEAVAVSA